MIPVKTHALASYGKIANAETDRLQQIIMLYDGAIRFLRLAVTDIENKDLIAKAEHTSRALDIIAYLQAILDFERGGEVARTLDGFYGQISALVLRASATLDAALMSRAADLLVPVRDAWAEARASQLVASPVLSPHADQPVLARP
ncbi:flagellar export chaperone FliS [Pyrinomonas methylaliphatogenes]|uniref:Flagellar biosynthetic protein FliS n=1 Tax=Pyrinomonas methylaliphatogenes TaxID=454194 RepID=A0A0B6WVZ3_9BACT|nr:flagellar export chaperone FliS [Pyrinomonas methylaliphatogenes]CDM64922.1 flagellar biosynthetic protein FliS [Pyrinomonas methylaliphatogenes]